MKHYGAQIPAKPNLRKYARCIEHQVWKTEYFLSRNLILINSNKFLWLFIIKTYMFHEIELHLVFHRRLEFINWPTCWPWEQHFQYTVVFMLNRDHQIDKRCSRKKQLATVSTDTNSLPKDALFVRQERSWRNDEKSV